MQETYYTAQEAMNVLKKPRSTFFKEVEEGLIPFEIEEGRQRGRLFPKNAIDTLAKRQLRRKKGKEVQELVFSPSSVADTWTEVQIGLEIYGEDDIVPFEKLLDWRDANDETQMSVKAQGKVVGYTALMPLDEQVLQMLVQDKIRERDIPIQSIKKWTEPRLSVYVCSLTVLPTNNRNIDKERGSFLIKQTIRWALRINQQYDIKNWYGIGATPEGQHILSNLGFKEIVSLYDGERKGYLLEDIKTAVPVIRRIFDDMRTSERRQSKKSN
jgi:hypothetical protein